MTISQTGSIKVGDVQVDVVTLVGPTDTEVTTPAVLYGNVRKRMAFCKGDGTVLDLTTGGGGGGAVDTVNGIAPDGSGNVAISGATLQTFFTTPNSANLAAAVSDETGSGALVFAASPALTGSPTAPTQTALDNSTKIASTAYVDTADALHAVKSQVFSAPVFIGTVADGVLFNMRMVFACTLTDIYVKTSSGTTSVQAKKNGSNVGSANSASSVEAHQGSLSTAFADGDYLEFDAASTSSALNLVVVAKFTRTLA